MRWVPLGVMRFMVMSSMMPGLGSVQIHGTDQQQQDNCKPAFHGSSGRACNGFSFLLHQNH